MTVYNVLTKKEIEDRIETNNTLRADNVFRITNGDQYILKHDGTIEIHRPQSHIPQNTRKHSKPHIKESLANLRLSHKSKRNTINAMQSLGMLSITSKPTINKHRMQKQKSTKQLSLSSMKYNRYPNYVRRKQTNTRKYHRRLKL